MDVRDPGIKLTPGGRRVLLAIAVGAWAVAGLLLLMGVLR